MTGEQETTALGRLAENSSSASGYWAVVQLQAEQMGLVQVAATGGQGGATKASGASRGQQAGARLARVAARAEDVGLRVVGVGERRRRVAADIGEGLHEEDEQFLFLSSFFFFFTSRHFPRLL